MCRKGLGPRRKFGLHMSELSRVSCSQFNVCRASCGFIRYLQLTSHNLAAIWQEK